MNDYKRKIFADTLSRQELLNSEDEPLEYEIAIDFEMLGKVFESLTDSDSRKKSEAFYTPREIVHYACQECLISYVDHKIGLNDDDIREFFTHVELLPYHDRLCWLKYCPDKHYSPVFPEIFENEKIIFLHVIDNIDKRLLFSYYNEGLYRGINHKTAQTICESCKDFDFVSHYDMKFLLRILNSNLINWYFKTFISDEINFYPVEAQQLPIIELQKKSRNESTQEFDSQIDGLIYELYSLNSSDISII